MAFNQMRYKLEDGKVLKNIFPSDADMDGWFLDPESAAKGEQIGKKEQPKAEEPKVEADDNSSGHSVRSGGTSKSKGYKR